jgi:hypothetical protein
MSYPLPAADADHLIKATNDYEEVVFYRQISAQMGCIARRPGN